MLNRFNILYNIFNNKTVQFFIEYLVKFKFIHKYKIYIFYPLLIPKNDTAGGIKYFLNIYSYFLTYHIIDFGCGSGIFNIIIKYILYKSNCFSIDNFYLNNKIYKINILKTKNQTYINSNYKYFFHAIKKINFIFSNPPYVSINNNLNKDKINFFESPKTIRSKIFGIYNLYEITKHSYNLLLENGNLFFEHGYNQSKKLRKILLLLGFTNIYTYKDLNNLTRFTHAEK